MNSFYFCNLCIFVYISGLFIWTRGVLGLICHCDYHCPDDHVNFTCQTNYKCFKTRQFEEGTKNIVERHGCIGNREGEGMFQCRSEKTKFKTPMQLQCCDDQDICNWHLTPTIPQQHIDEYHFNLEKTNGEAPTNNHAQGLALAISISICAMILFIIVAYMGFRCAQIKAKHKSQKKRRFVIPHGTAPVDSMHELLLDGNHSSGTGSGKPQMTQRTIAHQLTFLEEVGRGRFAIVYKTKWKDQFFATKVVRSFDEASWKNELEIFEKCNLSHENVLGYVGGDVLESTPGQEVQRLIISSYHEFGTLHRFLLNHSYDVNVLFRLVYTALSGIVHLHRDFLGSQGKPKLAHRNITSKNIYVKDDLQCCIGDFGLAVAQPEDGPLNLRQNPRLPTSRYMPPDMLADLSRIEMQSFDTFQRGDMYSFGLCLWEMILRYEVKATPEEYSLPYTEYLKKNPNEPEYTEMRRLVTVEKKRCQLPQRYHEDQHSRFLMRLINGCWHEQPTMRVTALRMRASLEKYLQERSKSEGSGESTSSVGTAASLGTASTGLS